MARARERERKRKKENMQAIEPFFIVRAGVVGDYDYYYGMKHAE